jgi:hypothetical protein
MQRQIAEDFEMPELDPRFNPLATLDNSQSINLYANDHKLFVSFYTKPVMNPLKSTEAGRQVFDEKDYIRIMTPGSQLCVIDEPIKSGNYLSRFGDRYSKWKAGQQELISGTPLDAFPWLIGKIGLLAELKALNIHTVEQLSTLPDSAMHNMMGGHELRKRAAEWLDQTTGTDAKVAKMSKENDDLKAQMAAMQDQMKQLMAAKAPAAKG